MKAVALRSAVSVTAHCTHPRVYTTALKRCFAPIVASKPLRSARAAHVQIRAMSGDASTMIATKNKENSVMVYSKTYCPYCTEVKSLFSRLGVDAKVVELDKLADGADVQAGLASLTGRKTVPQVFIGGQHVGGCDDTLEAHQNGKLKELLGGVGISI